MALLNCSRNVATPNTATLGHVIQVEDLNRKNRVVTTPIQPVRVIDYDCNTLWADADLIVVSFISSSHEA